MPRRRATSVAAAPISCAMASSSTSLAPLARSDSTASMPCECPAIGHRRGAVQVQALSAQRPNRGDLGQQDAGHRRSPPRSAAWLWAPTPQPPARAPSCSGSKPIGRTTTSSRATGASSSAGLTGQSSRSRTRCPRRHQLLQVFPARRCPGRRRRPRTARRRSDDRPGRERRATAPGNLGRIHRRGPADTVSYS